MTFPFSCSNCGYVNQFGWSQIGQKITCGGCEKTMTVPVPRETVGPPASPSRPGTFRCPSCRRKYAVKRELVGKKIRCTGCGAGVRVPAEGEGSLAELSNSAVGSASGTGRAERPSSSSRKGRARNDDEPDARDDDEPVHYSPLHDELGWIKKAKPPRPAGAVLPSRTELIEQEREKFAEEEFKKKRKADKSRKPRKKKTGYFDAKETLKLVAGVGAFVAALAFLAWGYPEFRFPLGGLLCVIGFIVYLLGSAALRQLVAEEGPLKAIFFRICPPYQWWYVMTHWDETRDFVAFFLAGSAFIMAIAITGMHYLGMSAANFADGSLCVSGEKLDPNWLALIVTATSFAVLVGTLASSASIRAASPSRSSARTGNCILSARTTR